MIEMFFKSSIRIFATVSAWSFAGCAPVSDISHFAPRNFIENRYASTVRQKLDFTCGAAALATVLTYYWGRATTEEEVLEILSARYPNAAAWKKQIQDGFSFDDLAFVALVLGFESVGAKVPLEQLSALSGPVIVHLNKGKFQHFSVLRKTEGDVFYLSDPTTGLVGIDRGDFERQYTGNALAIWKAGAPLPVQAPLAVIRDGLSLYSSFGQVHRDVYVPQVRTF